MIFVPVDLFPVTLHETLLSKSPTPLTSALNTDVAPTERYILEGDISTAVTPEGLDETVPFTLSPSALSYFGSLAAPNRNIPS